MTLEEATREQVLDSWGWHIRYWVMEARAARCVDGDQGRAAYALDQAGTYRKRLAADLAFKRRRGQ